MRHTLTDRSLLSAASTLCVLLALTNCRGTHTSSSAESPQPPPPLPERCLMVAATNDLHGAIEPHQLRAGEHQVRVGGVLGLSGYVQRLRQQYGDKLVLLDGGDLFQGTLAANLSQGRSVITAYNLLGYDATAIGNHEFDFAGGADHLGVIKARIAQAKFPFLGANVFDRASGQKPSWRNFERSVLLERGGLRVGIVGVAAPDTPRLTRPTNVEALRFTFPVASIIEEATALRQRGADLVIMVAHIGASCESVSDPNDTQSCDKSGLLFSVLKALPPGTIDVAIGGHTHAEVAHWIHGVAAIESGSSGVKIGRVQACARDDGRGLDATRTKIFPPLDICLDVWHEGGCDRRATASGTRLATLWGDDVQPTPSMIAAMAPYLEAVRAEQTRTLGFALPRPLKRDQSSESLGESLGVKVAESLRQAVGAQVGLQNIGGVRSDLPAGPLTFGEVYRVLPFDNQVAVLKLDGKRLRQMIAHMARERQGQPPYLAGLVAVMAPDGWILRFPDGTPVDDASDIVVATNDYLAQGGEGLGELLKGAGQATATDMREALITQLRREFGGDATSDRH